MITCNDQPVIEMRLTLPLVGAWVAELEVAESDDRVVTGRVLLQDDVAQYRGTIVRSATRAQVVLMEIVGGAGGLARDIAARSYRGVSARDVITDLLTEVGESLDSISSPTALSTILPYWTRVVGSAGAALAQIVDAISGTWRVLPNGAIWIGTETWPHFRGDDPLELDVDGAANSVLLAPDAIDLRPGVTLGTRKIGRVEHRVNRSHGLRTTFWAVQ